MFPEVEPNLGTLMVLMGLQILNLILLVFYYVKLKNLSETTKEILGDVDEFHEYENHVHPVLGSYTPTDPTKSNYNFYRKPSYNEDTA